MKLLKSLFIGMGILLSSSASAAIITFDFSGPGGNQLYDSLSFSSGGYTLTVKAFAKLDGVNIGAQVEQFTQGLGVKSDTQLVQNDNKLDTDGTLEERLFFTLTSVGDPDPKFSWMEIFFGSKWASQLEEGEGAQLRFGYPHKANFITGPTGSYAVDLDGFSTIIEVKPGSGADDNGFRIQGMALDVPEPSSLAVLSLGLLGLGLRRFKKA